jgi:Ca-activated chloride channel family protein
VTLLNNQLASGLWDGPVRNDTEHVRQARATAYILLELLRMGVTTTHAQHSGQVKKAVQALITVAEEIAANSPQVAEFALGVAWLVTTGQHTRAEIEALVSANPTFVALKPVFGDEHMVRAHVEQLAA